MVGTQPLACMLLTPMTEPTETNSELVLGSKRPKVIALLGHLLVSGSWQDEQLFGVSPCKSGLVQHLHHVYSVND